VEALHEIGARQGRWPPRNRPFARTGVDLDPRADAEFEILVALSPYTLLADGWDQDHVNIYDANDEGGLWLNLSTEEHAQIVECLGGDGHALTPHARRRSLWRRILGPR